MTHAVLCLRPRADFERVDALPPASLAVSYARPDDPQLSVMIARSRALVIPALGAKLAAPLFEGARLALVQVTGAGFDRLDAAAMKRLGIPVANVPGGSNAALAEYAVTAASLLLRRFAWADAEVRAGNYAAFRARMLADNLSGIEGLTVGLIGLGTIGTAVARAFERSGCTIVYFDPAPREAPGARRVGLDELLAVSDVVSVHVPLLPETTGLIGERELAAMKPGAVLVQASRGGVVDEAALARALESGRLGGAAVDVYSSEPPAPDHPLLALRGDAARRLLLTPHVAGVTRQSSALLFRSAWANVERVLVKGEPPHHRVY
ncbi:MAG TPA: D-isomer specific 2-hydroxyacid dehydrogenase family protein [Burkholderiales bacterium]